jgi:4-amino-4-deoxy-L-arabinose transferase-like glycosyltransferase
MVCFKIRRRSQRLSFSGDVRVVGFGHVCAEWISRVAILLLFGLSEASIRMPHLVLGIASLALFYSLTRRIIDRPTAVTALLLLAINPWHIMISRWGLDSNILPGMFLIAVFLLVLSLHHKRYLPWSACVLGLCLYLYGTAYVVVPVFTLIAAIALKFLWKTPWSSLGVSALVAGITGLPIALYVLINQFKWNSIVLPFMSIPRLSGTPRFQTVSSVFSGDWDAIMRNLGDFWRLMLWQDDGLIWNTLPGYGLLYLIGLPFVFIGIFVAIKRIIDARGKDPSIFILAWLAASIVLAALQSVNVNRINIIFIPLIFFCALGVQTAGAGNRVVRNGIISIFIVFFTFFTHTYFTWYPAEASDDFFTGLGPAIEHSVEATDGNICVTDRVNMPYIFALFYEETDPRQFHETVVYENPGAEFQWATHFGRFTFGLHRCNEGPYDAYVLHQDELDEFDNGGYDIRVFDHYATAIPL